MTPPRVTVLMPVYNTAAYLREAVESILGQTFADFEFIAVDDGSTDGSVAVLEEYAAIDGRLRVIVNDRNHGIVYTLNRGLDAASGEFIARMDSDDIALPDRLERQIRVMVVDPSIAALGGAVSYIDERGHDLGVVRASVPDEDLLFGTPLLHPTVVMRRSALGPLRYEERFRLAEDYHLWLRLAKVGRLAALPETVLRYRLSPGASRVRSLRKMILRTLQVKVEGVRHLGYRPSGAALIRFIAEALLFPLPQSFVFRLYCKKTFGRSAGIMT